MNASQSGLMESCVFNTQEGRRLLLNGCEVQSIYTKSNKITAVLSKQRCTKLTRARSACSANRILFGKLDQYCHLFASTRKVVKSTQSITNKKLINLYLQSKPKREIVLHTLTRWSFG